MIAKIQEFFRTLSLLPALLRAKRETVARPLDVIDSCALRLEDNAKKVADRTAVIDEQRSLTWAEFNAEVNRYAWTLKKQGIGHHDKVALMLENRIELLALILAAHKLGACAALINTSLSGHPVAHCANLAEAKLFLVGEECLDAVDEARAELKLQDGQYLMVRDGKRRAVPRWAQDLDSLVNGQSEDNPPDTQQVALGDLALNIYTSGTTGLPKAACISQQRLLRGAIGTQLLIFKNNPDDVVYLCLPLYHATGLILGFSTALLGASASVLRRKFSASRFLKDIREHNCTCMAYVGEMCRYLMHTAKSPDDHKNPLKRMVGNGLRPDIWMAFKERYGIEHIGEIYGASEGNLLMLNSLAKDCTIGATTAPHAVIQYDVPSDEILRDDQGFCKRVDQYQPGLLIGKIEDQSPFEGYSNEEATESKILRNVFEEGDAYFNTGDLIKEVDVGFALGLTHYQFVDRIGDTYRWKSENVSTNEVAEIVNQHPDVRIANVYGVSIPHADGRAGMATLTLKGEELDLDSFAKHVFSELPNYARPVFLRIAHELGTTGTHKLMKEDLKEEGYDLNKIEDTIFVLKPGSDHYERLTQDFVDLMDRDAAGF